MENDDRQSIQAMTLFVSFSQSMAEWMDQQQRHQWNAANRHLSGVKPVPLLPPLIRFFSFIYRMYFRRILN